MQQQVLITVILAFVVGLIWGSFITMASWRLPRRLGWNGRSRCPNCGKPINPSSLVPVASWVMNKGQSSCCGQPISWRYPATEIVTGFLFAAAAWRFGISIDSFFIAAFIVILMMIVVIDFEHRLIPDELNAALAIAGLAWQIYRSDTLWLAIAAGLLLGIIAYFTAWLMEKMLKRETLGGGDIKYLAAAGLWTGFWAVPWLLIYGGLLGIVIGLIYRAVKKESVFPFGPALCAALYAIVVFGVPLPGP